MYLYKVWSKVRHNLGINTNGKNVTIYNNYNRLRRDFLKGLLDKNRPIIFLGMTNGDKKLKEELIANDYMLYPNYDFSKFIYDRNTYLPEVDSYLETKGVSKPKRLYFKNESDLDLNTINLFFDEQPVVMKVGNLHAAANKFKLNYPYKSKYPILKIKHRKLPITVEEFVPDARSIRVGYCGVADSIDSYFVTEHKNTSWLKNDNPTDEITYSLSDALNSDIPFISTIYGLTRDLAKYYNSDLLGVDWVVTEKGFMLLELNDIIGLPDGDYALGVFSNYIQEIVNKHS